MSFDIEHQLATHQIEDVELSHPDPDPATPRSRSCWSSFYPIVVKAVTGVGILVGGTLIVAVAVSLWATLFALAMSLCAPLLALAGVFFAIAVALVLGSPVILPLMFILVFSLPKKTLKQIMGDDDVGDDDNISKVKAEAGMGGMYDLARRKEQLWDRIMIGSFGIIARASLAAVLWLAISLLVPRLKAATLLGSPMWKWSLLGVTLTAGYFQAITFVMLLLFWPTGTASYYLDQLLLSINHVAYFGLVLVTWLVYFRTHHGLDHPSTPRPQAFEYVTWSYVSLFVGSILWLFKNLLLVKWSADAIYRRFEPRILVTSLKFYFIGLVAAGFSEDAIVKGLEEVVDQYGSDESLTTDEEGPKKLTSVTKYVMSRKMGLSYLDKLSRILISLGEIMSPLLDREGDEEEVVSWFKQQIKDDHTSDSTCTPDGLLKLFPSPAGAELPSSSPKGDVEPSDLSSSSPKGDAEPSESPSSKKGQWKRIMDGMNLSKKFFKVKLEKKSEELAKKEKKSEELRENNKKLANVLCRLVGEECSSAAGFTFDNLKIWMVDSHKDCINMGRTLADSKAIVTRLDIFMSFIICVIVLLLWLLITGVSSTTVLVTVATPFLALTFIFGDTAKIFFQGLIFCFATHPFDVGDRCVLDGIELEVKNVSILTTTFIKIGSKEKRLYPNSVLATKAIVNLGWQPDPKDVVELPLDPSTNLDDLKAKITKFLEDEKHRYGNLYDLMISEVGDNIKVRIHFSHVLTVHDLSHSQCYKKKSSQRSDFLNMIKKYINKSRIEVDARDQSKTPMPYQDPSQYAL